MGRENAAADSGGSPEYSRCTAVLEQERELVTKIAGLQALIRKAVVSRQWMDFEALLGELGRIGAQIEDLDADRIRIFSVVAGKAGEGSAGFYTAVSRFPPDERKAVAEVYRKLRMEARKVRLESGALMNYIAGAGLLVTGFLEAAFPDRKGRIYSRSGAQVQADMRSMIVNRHF
ncbi:MAG: hypothetical protein LBH70_09825 [Spirochaetaceae bacterium]|jgi:hypothetical protein|nr:hypothetical protein [Spirochaetaceae bacterium]